jgi:hypothetical protein
MDTDESKARQAARDRHRDRVNIIGGVALAVFLLILYGATKLFVQHEDLQKCLDSGRKNCVDLGAAPRDSVRLPTR